MAAEVAEFGFECSGLVTGMAESQRARLEHYSPFPPKLGVVLSYPHPDNRSYGLQTLVHAQMLTEGRPGAIPPVELHIPQRGHIDVVTTPDEYFEVKRGGIYVPQTDHEKRAHDELVLDITQGLGARHDIFKELVLAPGATPEGTEQAAAAIPLHKDVDGAAPNSRTTRATPEAAVLMGECMLGHVISKLRPEQIGVVGNGPRVMRPLVEQVLPSRDIDITRLGMHLKTTPEIQQGLSTIPERDLKIVFIALPVGAILLSQHVPDGTVVVDMGQGHSLDGSIYAGNAHPDLVARHTPNGAKEGVKVNGLRRSGGWATTAVVFDRTIPEINTYPSDFFTPNRELAAVG